MRLVSVCLFKRDYMAALNYGQQAAEVAAKSNRAVEQGQALWQIRTACLGMGCFIEANDVGIKAINILEAHTHPDAAKYREEFEQHARDTATIQTDPTVQVIHF